MNHEMTMPPERFYWAVLDEPCPRRLSPRRRARLGFAFESVLPVPIESVHTAYIPIPGGALACAMERSDLEQARADGAISLTPASMPDGAGDRLGNDLPPQRLNLLTGPFEPLSLMRRRRRRAVEAVAAMLLVTAALAIGIQRRIAASSASAVAADQLRSALLAEVLPRDPTSTQAPELRLVAELRRLQRTRAAPSGAIAATDAAAPLAALLAAWPADLHVRTRQVRATPTEIQIQVALDAIEDADALAAALGAASGWEARLPQVGPDRARGYLASVTFRRVQPAEAPGPQAAIPGVRTTVPFAQRQQPITDGASP
ncbi:MAG: hypothetical protein ACF8R7_00700 [Phycisphaerales bacterium JB039]